MGFGTHRYFCFIPYTNKKPSLPGDYSRLFIFLNDSRWLRRLGGAYYLYPMHHPTENPWQLTGEKPVYDNKWINVTEYQVINPAGNPGIYGKVHFKNRAIGVIPL